MSTKVAIKCAKCDKTISSGTGKSFTAWLFRPAECKCEAERSVKAKSKTQDLLAPKTTDDSRSIGSVVDDRYEIRSLLGAGGMGSVYLVFDKQLQIECALKMIAPHLADQDSLVKRLEHEAQAAKSLTHQNIVAVHDYGNTPGGTAYMVMDYIQGQTLAQLIESERAPTFEHAVKIFLEIAAGLNHAHSKGVIHRDLKPSNVLLQRTADGNEVVKIVDFGIAKISDAYDADKTKLTQTGELLGSPNYMSPEQCKGDEQDARSDIYSLGCIMYEVLSGHPPFDAENPVRILLKHISEAPPALPKYLKLNSALQRIVVRCLAKDPADRYQTAQSLIIDLEHVRDGKRLERKTHRWTKKQIRNLFLLSALVLALVFSIGPLFEMWSDANLAPYRPNVVNGKSLEDLNKEIEKNPKNAVAYNERGNFHRARDERENAIDDYTRAIELDPNYGEAYLSRCRLYWLLARFDKAQADCERLIEQFPLWSLAYYQRAELERVREQYQKSIADAQQVLVLNSNSIDGTAELSKLYGALGQHDKALECAFRAVQLAERSEGSKADLMFFAYENLAETYLQAHQADKAIEAMKSALQIHHRMSNSWGYLASAYAAKGNMPEAMRCIVRCSRLDSFPARAHRLSGEMYRTAGMWKEAIENYSTSTSLEPWYGPGFNQKALAEIADGDLNSAELDLKRALALQPWSTSSNSDLSMVEDQLGDDKSAQSHMAKALSLNSAWPMNYVNRARISLHHGEVLKAVDDCNRAIAMDNYLTESYATRSVALSALGRKADAGEDMATAVRLGWHDFSKPLNLHPANSSPVNSTLAAAANIAILRPRTDSLAPSKSIVWTASNLSAKQEWAIATSTIWLDTMHAKTRANRLEAWSGDPYWVTDAKEILNPKALPGETVKKKLHVVDNESLIQELDNIEKRGHREEFDELAAKVSDMSAEEIAAYRLSLGEHKRKLARVDVVLNSYRHLGAKSSKTVVAFDYVQYISRCRLGYLAGYISEQDAWNRIMRVALKIQSTFDSWEDLAACYEAGREFYYFGRVPNRELFKDEVQKLLHDPDGPFQKLPFKMPLT